jgi:hypothetical protein
MHEQHTYEDASRVDDVVYAHYVLTLRKLHFAATKTS